MAGERGLLTHGLTLRRRAVTVDDSDLDRVRVEIERH